MNIYTNNQFTGLYPVGTAALVVAQTREIAAEILNNELESRGLDGDAHAHDMVIVDAEHVGVTILCDGNY